VTNLPEFKKILVATDGSELADRAVGYALALARQTGAALSALYVVDADAAFRSGIHESDAMDQQRQDGRAALQAAVARGREAGVEVEPHLRDGSPGSCVLAEARRLSADVIVLGSYGAGGLMEALLGSVSRHILQHAEVPVLVVRPAKRA
jgi:nucleotide-binding universal stress UspA family protein